MIHGVRLASSRSASANSSRLTPAACAWAATLAARISISAARLLGLWLFGHETAAALHLDQKPFGFELGIGALHGIEIDRKLHRDFAHGGKLRARRKSAAPDRGGDLIAQLHIDRNAIILKRQPIQHGKIV